MSFKVIKEVVKVIKTLLKEYTKIWRKFSSLMNIEFDSGPVYGDNDKYIKTKIKICGDKVNTNFHDKKIPKEKTVCKCLSLIMLGSVIRVNQKYYPKTLLEECKYEIKKTKMENLINDDLELSSPNNETDSDSEKDTDNESDNEKVNE